MKIAKLYYAFCPINDDDDDDDDDDGDDDNNNINNNNGRRITQMTNEKREGAFLSQRLSMVIQRYNAVAIQGTFALTSPEDEP